MPMIMKYFTIRINSYIRSILAAVFLIVLVSGCGTESVSTAPESGVTVSAQGICLGGTVVCRDTTLEEVHQSAPLQFVPSNTFSFQKNNYKKTAARASGMPDTIEQIIPTQDSKTASYYVTQPETVQITCFDLNLEAVLTFGFCDEGLNSVSIDIQNYTADDANLLKNALETAFGAVETPKNSNLQYGFQYDWCWDANGTRIVLVYCDYDSPNYQLKELVIHFIFSPVVETEPTVQLPLDEWQATEDDIIAPLDLDGLMVRVHEQGFVQDYYELPGAPWGKETDMPAFYGISALPGPDIVDPELWFSTNLNGTDFLLTPVFIQSVSTQKWYLCVGTGQYDPQKLQHCADLLMEKMVLQYGEPIRFEASSDSDAEIYYDWNQTILDDDDSLLSRLSLEITRQGDQVVRLAVVLWMQQSGDMSRQDNSTQSTAKSDFAKLRRPYVLASQKLSTKC